MGNVDLVLLQWGARHAQWKNHHHALARSQLRLQVQIETEVLTKGCHQPAHPYPLPANAYLIRPAQIECENFPNSDLLLIKPASSRPSRVSTAFMEPLVAPHAGTFNSDVTKCVSTDTPGGILKKFCRHHMQSSQ
jgi:hypothetical protein